MKKYYSALLCLCFGLLSLNSGVLAQDVAKTAKQLVNEGIELHDAEKYSEAIDKYKAALQIDPNYQTANYEIGNTLYEQEKYEEAVVYLKKVIAANKSDMPDAYNLLGNIYDDMKDVPMAIATYKKGIAIDPEYQRLHFNLAICYYRQDDKYAEAEAEVKIALKLEPDHKSSHLLYGNVSYYEKKTMPAILGYCSFLLKDGTSSKAESAIAKLKDLLSGGGAEKIDTYAQFEKALQSNLAVASLASVASGYDDIYKNFFAAFFRKLVDSPVFPAFSRYISVTAFQEENMAWFKANPAKATELDDWVEAHPRSFTN